MSDSRPDLVARAAALSARAAALGEAQAAVASAAREEAAVLAGAMARVFDRLPLREFPALLLPRSARVERRLRHKVLRETRRQDDQGGEVAFLLLGRDGVLRVFVARSTSARDLDDTLATARVTGEVRRELAEWVPGTRYAVFGAATVLEGLTTLVEDVERRIAAAESRVAVQVGAFASGDLARITAALAPARAVPGAVPRPPVAPAAPAPAAPAPPPAEPSWLSRAVRAGARTPAASLPSSPDVPDAGDEAA